MCRVVERLSLASVERLCETGALAIIGLGAAAFLALTVGRQTAQYGRHASSPSLTTAPSTSSSRRRGFFSSSVSSVLPSSLPANWAWLTQELPALLLAPVAFALTLRALHENEEEVAGKSRWWFSSPPPPAAGNFGSLLRLSSEAPLPNRLLLLAFALHYSWRSLAYPFLIRGGKETRTLEWALALAFCCLNGALQGAGAALVGGGRRRSRPRGLRAPSSPPLSSSSTFYRVLFGVSLCFWGLFWGLNLAADAHLRSLRKKKKKTRKTRKTTAAATATAGNGGEGEEEEEELEDRGYRLPTSALFSLVACPNYGAECAEWASFAAASFFASRAAAAEGESSSSSSVAGESLPSLAFALFTAANLVPRALSHRRWYLEKFEDFPRGRKAIFPWVL